MGSYVNIPIFLNIYLLQTMQDLQNQAAKSEAAAAAAAAERPSACSTTAKLSTLLLLRLRVGVELMMCPRNQ